MMDADGHADGDGPLGTAETHCAACHLVRLAMPAAAALAGPAILPIRRAPPRAALVADLSLPDGPTRPPRPRPTA